MSVNIVKTDLITDATLPPPFEPGVRRLLRRLGLMGPAPHGLSLFQANMAAYRFETDDGRACVVRLPNEMVADPALDTEAEARRLAIPSLEKLRVG